MDSESDCSMELATSCKPFKLPCLVPLDVLKARFSDMLEVDWPGDNDKSPLPRHKKTTSNGRHSIGSNGSDSSGIENDRRITFVNLSDDDDDSHSDDGGIEDIISTTSFQKPSDSRAFRGSSHRTNGAYSPDDSKFTIPHPPPPVILKKTPKRFLSSTTAKNSRASKDNGRRSTTTTTNASSTKSCDGDMRVRVPKPGPRGKQRTSSSKRELQQKVLDRQLPRTPSGQPINMDGQDIIDTKNHVEDTMIIFLPEMCQRLGLSEIPKDPMDLCLKFSLIVPQLDLKIDDTMGSSMED